MTITPTPEFLQLQPVVAGRYWIERELEQGGMGVVFLARDVALDRPVALKLLPHALAIQPELRERFLREARTRCRQRPLHCREPSPQLRSLAAHVRPGAREQRRRAASPRSPTSVVARRIVRGGGAGASAPSHLATSPLPDRRGPGTSRQCPCGLAVGLS